MHYNTETREEAAHNFRLGVRVGRGTRLVVTTVVTTDRKARCGRSESPTGCSPSGQELQPVESALGETTC
jgi:hypothetical protein